MFTCTSLKSYKCLLSVVFFCTAQAGGQQSVNDTCVHRSGDPARCKSMSHCPEATIPIDRGFKPILCEGSQEGEQLICCREDTSLSQPLLSVLSENHNESRQNDSVPSGEKGSTCEDKECIDSAHLKILRSQRTHGARSPLFPPSNAYSSPQNLDSGRHDPAENFWSSVGRPTEHNYWERFDHNLKSFLEQNNNRGKVEPSRAIPEWFDVPRPRPITQRPVQPAPMSFTQEGRNSSRDPISIPEFNHPENPYFNDDSDSRELHGDTSKMRISELMCANYSVFMISLNPQGLSLRPVAYDFRINVCTKRSVPLIIGGKNAMIGEFPHMALLGYLSSNNETDWVCGGSLISDYFVLTAAHCVLTYKGRPKVVRLGEHNLLSSDDGSNTKDYSIAEFITHPRYNSSFYYNDIALLRLKDRVQFHNSTRPACLPSENFTFTTAIATGWGLLDTGGEKSNVLQKVQLNPIANVRCTRSYRPESLTLRLFKGIDHASQMCYGDDGEKDTAPGDSGGPLQVSNENCNYYVVGITSFGKKRSGVYTRVQHYLDWIESIVWPNS